MEFNLIKDWTLGVKGIFPLVIRNMTLFDDQYCLEFFKTKKVLHLNMLQTDCFCFFTEIREIPFKKDSKLNLMNRYLKKSTISEPQIINNDRIIRFKIKTQDLELKQKQVFLVLELIPHRQNIFLIDEDESIIDIVYKNDPSRDLVPGKRYIPPSRKEPYRPDDEGFGSDFSHKKKVNIYMHELFFNEILPQKKEGLIREKLKKINRKIRNKEKKLLKLEKEFNDTEKAQQWKEKAELLKANFNLIKKGDRSIILTDYYKEDQPEIEIELDPGRNAAWNIEQYFRKYKKSLSGREKIKEQIDKTQDEIVRLQDEIKNIEISDPFVVKGKADNKSPKLQGQNFRKLILSEDWEILIGRNNRENDQLTTKIARSWDWWFHSRIYRGSHIILRNLKKKELPEKYKILCCRLAAFYSKARNSLNVPVDYTQIRYVRKPRGSAPGKVVYTHHKTLFVDPLDYRTARKNHERS